ncbi:hypothetical protein N4G70_01180 [Streptomyces sp. ASQP_92]|uniref:hypothetical protein n=1 Tax=Streptomyces sp. ASQP_92 TaxID=2979116 RepID=UPI0021BE4B9D|nr:hypothetical protein [Streptomyces sp. ASQP_92]MCT9087474.1 hypothetical protein [Streptomyces sp. ASQP_92]
MSIVPEAVRREAVAAWLAGSLNRPRNAHQEWAACGIALLALGRRFSALRVAEELVCATARGTDTTTVNNLLRDALHGPVIHDPRGRRFYVLVPSSPPVQSLGPYATYLGLGTYLGVPHIEWRRPDERHGGYWAVPMETPGALCDPDRVLGLIEAGSAALDEGGVS